MILYNLAYAHPSFVPPIRQTIDALAARYPRVPLREVRLYDPKPGDRSMARTTAHEIALNPYWFSRPADELKEAAKRCTDIRLRGHVVKWHGGMTDEPIHLCTHEFAHSLSHALPGWRVLAGPARNRALADPSLAVSGYGLSNNDEYFAELFAAYELGLRIVDSEAAKVIGDLLDER